MSCEIEIFLTFHTVLHEMVGDIEDNVEILDETKKCYVFVLQQKSAKLCVSVTLSFECDRNLYHLYLKFICYFKNTLQH